MWFSLSLPITLVSFEFITNSIIGTFCLLLGNWCSYNSVVRNLWKNILKDQVFLHFDKIPNYFRQILQIYSEICIFLCATKKCSPEAVGKDWSQTAREILWWKWWQCHEIHSKFGPEIWKKVGTLGILFFMRFCSNVMT